VKVKNKHYRTVWMEKGVVKLINQTLIPHKFEIKTSANYQETAKAIKDMIVRGAPAIGAAAAYGIVQAVNAANSSNFGEYIKQAEICLKNTRPTAKDLFTAIDYVMEVIKDETSLEKIKSIVFNRAEEYANKSADACKKIGEYGAELIKDGDIIETHCNAGWLACVDWGTALSPIYHAKQQGKQIFVYVDETRPRCQGSNLTAWELAEEGVPHRVIPDNAGAYYMSKGVSMMMVGADRIAANGDVANKIGTYEKAIVAKEFGIPFYVAAPMSTFDLSCLSGKDIPIEERSEDEVAYVHGWSDNGNFSRVRIMPVKSRACNPSFDVTPSKYIAGIITEKGIIKPDNESILNLFAVNNVAEFEGVKK